MMDIQARDYLAQAVTLMGVPDYPQAEKLIHRALEQEPEYRDAYSVLGDLYVNTERYQEAMDAFQKSALLDPDDGETFFNMGSVAVLMDDLPKGIALYNTAVEKGYHHEQLYASLARIYRELHLNEQAVRCYDKAIRQAPMSFGLRLESAGLYLQMKQYEQALAVLDELRKLEPDLFEACALKAEVYCGMGRTQEALSLAQEACESFPDDPALKTLMARILIRMERYEQAQTILGQVLETVPETRKELYRNCKLMQAQIHLVQNSLKEAGDDLNQILQHEEEYDEEVRFLQMNVYYTMQDYDHTLEIALELSQLEEDNLFTVTGRYYVPFITDRTGKHEEAAALYRKLSSDLRRVTVRNPHFYEAYLYRLLCHKELKEYDKALELADYVEALDHHCADAYLLRSAIYSDMGDTLRAEQMKAKAARISTKGEREWPED